MLEFLRKGQVLTRVDRLARSTEDLQDTLRTERPIDASTAAGKCFLDMLGCSPSSRRTSDASASSRGSPGEGRLYL